jgi:NAD(P)-dependent dehydrogenase (short-subunit alcohol dehydrogenase family)
MNGKVVLITGSSAGIGKSTAELFAASGWRVAATLRKPQDAPTFTDPAGRIKTFALDVTDQASITRAVSDITAAYGQIDAVVNNAGYGLVGPFEAIDDAQIRRQFETNVFGLMNVTRSVLPHMRERRSGVIINVASVGGRLTFPYYSLYHSTKWAVEGFSESLAYELSEFNIRVKIIEPGPIKTDFYGRSEDQPSAAALGAYATTFQRVYARMKKSGTSAPGPHVVAEAILKAATDTSTTMRYTPNGGAMLAFRQIAGPGVYMSTMRRMLRMPS